MSRCTLLTTITCGYDILVDEDGECTMLYVGSALRLSLYVISITSLIRSIYVRGFPILPQRPSIYKPLSSPIQDVSLPPLQLVDSKNGIPNKSTEDILREEAIFLLKKAEALRKELPDRITESATSKSNVVIRTTKWNVPPTDENDDSSNESTGYRLYVNIGREEGTWMDPRWGASQRRMEFTIDIQFHQTTGVSKEQLQRMVQDNFIGSRSPVYNLRIAPYARFRNGFDEMKCSVDNGVYRIDTQNQNRRTVRFYITTDGKTDISYGDTNIPAGELYFSIPCFGNSDPKSGIHNLSTKDGIVSVRQIGWHTGWRRMESRIVGTFRATPIDVAKQRDGF